MELTKSKATATDEQDSVGIDPLMSVPVASLCFGIHREHFLTPYTIALVPSEGIVGCDQYLDISIKWLMWEMHKARKEGRKIHIQHDLNGGEVVVGKYRLGGCDMANKTIYEYNSCWYHGCDLCFDKGMFNSKLSTIMGHSDKKTMVKKSFF